MIQAEALATEPLRLEFQNRLYNDNRHGVQDLKTSLLSNSFKPSPVQVAEKEKKKENKDAKDSKKRKRDGADGKDGKKDGKGGAKDNNSKKTKVGDCSLCGLSCGHNDSTCWQNRDSDEAKKTIAANRANPEMKKFFKALDLAAEKRVK